MRRSGAGGANPSVPRRAGLRDRTALVDAIMGSDAGTAGANLRDELNRTLAQLRSI
ncbi:hypothetical protein [Streptomyces sp. NPDC003710]